MRPLRALEVMVLSGDGERRWYMVQTYVGYENKVKANIEQKVATMGLTDKVFRVLVPVEEKVVVKGGKRRTVKRKLFPGYVLVEMILDDQSWYVVRHTTGVTGFVGTDTQPIPLEDSEVREIMKRVGTAERKGRVDVDLEKGDLVRVVDGTFEDMTGTVVEVDRERGKVKMVVSLFGRDTPVEVEFWQIEKV